MRTYSNVIEWCVGGKIAPVELGKDKVCCTTQKENFAESDLGTDASIELEPIREDKNEDF